jgi:hypothetical protein
MRNGLSSRPPSSRHDSEEALWAEIIRCEIDSWNPRRLPARFQPGTPQPSHRFRGTLPAAFAVWLILLLAALTGLSSNVGVVLQNLAGVRAASPPAGAGQLADPAKGSGRQPSRYNRSRSSPGPSAQATAGAGPAGAPMGAASAPRTGSPAPGAQPPLPTAWPSDLTAPTPGDFRRPPPSPPLTDVPPSSLSRELTGAEHSRG